MAVITLVFKKMNPISIRIYHGNTSQVVTNHFCNMCLTEGEHGVEAESIFVAIEKSFELDNIPFPRNSLASCMKDKNSEIFISSCPFHLAHIAVSNANDAFSEVLRLNVENVCVDIFHWFDKSSKRRED